MTATAADIVAALEARYNPAGRPRQFATFTEVTDGAQKRRIDFLAVNLWQSRGRLIEGVEIKVQRRDWLRELAREKADAWFGVSDRWWIAAPPGVIKREELPPSWGYLEARKHGPSAFRLYVEREAEKLQPREAWPEWMVMRLLTRGEDRRKAQPEEIQEARDEGFESGTRYGKATAESQGYKDDGSRAALSELVQVLGGRELHWRPHEERIAQIRRAVKLLDSGQLDNYARNMLRLYRQAGDAVEAALDGKPEPDDIKF